MGMLAKPKITKNESSGEYIWHYWFRRYGFSRPQVAYANKVIYSKQAYVDTDYEARIAMGLPKLLMPYNVSRTTITNDPLVPYKDGAPGDMVGYDKFFGTVSSNQHAAIAKAISVAGQAWRDKLGDRDSINLGVALAEMKETVGLIASTALRIASAYRALRRLDVKEAFTALGIANNVRRPVTKYNRLKYGMSARKHKRLLERKAKIRGTDPVQFAAETWLEITYGWTPLLLDIYGGAEHVAKLLHETEYDISIGAGAKQPLVVTPQSPMNATGSCSGEVRVNYLYHLKIESPMLRQLSSLGLTNPMLIAWEIVPFSFVVDWFLPVGPYLKSLSVTEGYKIVQGALSTKVTMQAELTCTNSMYSGAGLQYSHESFSRVLQNKFPVAEFIVPDISDMLNIRRFTSAVALLKVLT